MHTPTGPRNLSRSLILPQGPCRRYSLTVRELRNVRLVVLAGFLAVGPVVAWALPAFPGAGGFGSNTPGGRGGRVIAVTTLADHGPGSLREAVTAPGPRTVVFRVAGEIRLKSHLRITEPFITIAGQTAPGRGIMLRDAGLYVQTHDVVIRFIRSRVGPSLVEKFDTQDALQISDDDTDDDNEVCNVVVDHCSFSWSIDEGVGIRTPAHDVTFSWNIISEALRQPFTKEQIGKDRSHSMALILSGGPTRCTLHHNLLAHCNSRNPRIQGGRHGFINNVVYDWGFLSGTFSRNPEVNFIGNYYKPGPASRVIKPICEKPGDMGRVYVKGNRSDDRPDDSLPEWDPIVNAPQQEHQADESFDMPPVTVTSADEAYEMVLRNAGATLPGRDPVDRRIVRQVRLSMGGKIDRPGEVGGYPDMTRRRPHAQRSAPMDTDNDGMPDDWEHAQGFDPDDPADGREDADHDGYTNLEQYLEYLVDRCRIPRPAVRTLSIDRRCDAPFAVHFGEVRLPVIEVGGDARTFYAHAFFEGDLPLEVSEQRADAEPPRAITREQQAAGFSTRGRSPVQAALGCARSFSAAVLKPARFHDHLTGNGKTLTFRVSEEGPRVIQPDASPDSPRLMLFLDAFPDKAAGLADANVIDARRFGVVGRRANDTSRLQAALDACAKLPGGGVVFVTDGKHEVDTLRIPSHATLHLGRSAVLYAGNEPDAGAIILFDGVEDAALTGPGVIDGRGSDGVLRAAMVRIHNARSVRISDVVLRDPGGPGIELIGSDDVHLYRAKVVTAGTRAGTGGLRIDGCRGVTCDRCFFSSSGDGITIESTDNVNPLNVGDIFVRETVVMAAGTGIMVGPGTRAPIREVLVRDVDVVSAANGISIMQGDTGGIENVVCRDVTMDLRELPDDPSGGRPFCVVNDSSGPLRHILFDRVVTNATQGSRVEGAPSSWIEEIRFWGVRIAAKEGRGREPPQVLPALFDLRRVRSPQFRFLYVTWPAGRERYWGKLLGSRETEGLQAPGNEIFENQAAPAASQPR